MRDESGLNDKSAHVTNEDMPTCMNSENIWVVHFHHLKVRIGVSRSQSHMGLKRTKL